MDNVQVWVYIAFAIIYFIIKGLKKNNPQGQDFPSRESDQPSTNRKPVSFEDLLKEFTEAREATKGQPKSESHEVEMNLPKSKKVEPIEEVHEDGETRRFADDESKRIYEESVMRAEQFHLDFERDDKFKSKMKRKDQEEEESQKAGDILTMLQDADGAKKAVILSEILNRKY